ncbi:MAG: hypothetical protein V3T58_01850 [Candidatus Hydrothermarchaeales archaeon]
MPKFLSAKELPKKLVEFKDAWYAVAQKCEGLSEYKSGLDEGFKDNLSEIKEGIHSCRNLIKKITPSMKRIMPQMRRDIDGFVAGLADSLETFEKTVEGDLEDVRALKRINKQLMDLNGTLEETEREFRKSEGITSEICTKYFERRRDYSQTRETITNATKEKLEGVKERFFQKLEPIVEGYGVSITGESIALEGLFKGLLEKSIDVERITLLPTETSKGLLDVFTGKKKINKEAREEVLKYISQEVLADANPIKAQEAKEIAHLDVEYVDLKALEQECKEAENQREKLSQPRESLMSEISKLKKSDVFILTNYDNILSIRDKYLANFEEMDANVKRILVTADELLKGYTQLEPDREKREIKLQLKDLKQNLEGLEMERLRLEDALRGEKEKSRRAEEILGRYREKLKGMNSKLKGLEEEIASLLKE